MRDIKFRAYSTVTGDFDYVSMVQLLTSDNSKISSKMIKDDLSIMQFTGLQDVNGADIYEGDILHQLDPLSWNPQAVCFDQKSASYSAGMEQLTCSTIITCELVIVGNLHENPELMEK